MGNVIKQMTPAMEAVSKELDDWNRKFGDDNGRMEIPSRPRMPCRHEPTLIFEAHGVKFYGASFSKLNAQTLGKVRADLLINLSGSSYYAPPGNPRPLIRRAPRWFAKLFVAPKIDEIIIDWPDMSVIDVGREFFETLWKAIKQQKKKNVVVFCVGGHGRTGTCVGCLMTVINGIHGGQAIRKVREYCRQAIETKAQETMVRSMTQRAVEKKGGATPSK